MGFCEYLCLLMELLVRVRNLASYLVLGVAFKSFNFIYPKLRIKIVGLCVKTEEGKTS